MQQWITAIFSHCPNENLTEYSGLAIAWGRKNRENLSVLQQRVLILVIMILSHCDNLNCA